MQFQTVMLCFADHMRGVAAYHGSCEDASLGQDLAAYIVHALVHHSYA